MMTHAVLARFAPVLLLLAACGGDGSRDEPSTVAEGELRGGRSAFLGRWKSSTKRYFKTIKFMTNGQFVGHVNVERLDGSCAAASGDNCTNITAGNFKVGRGRKLSIEVPKIVEVTPAAKTFELVYELSEEARKLVVDGPEGKQTFEYYAGCEDVVCDEGLACREGEDWGTPRCGTPIVPVPH